MTRFWPRGLPIRVEVDAAGMPRRLRWQERGHAVRYIVHRWRVDTGWWRGRVWREYMTLITTTGLLVVVYRDLTSGKWFLQRLYD